MQVEAARVTSVGDSRADVELVPVQGHCEVSWQAAPQKMCAHRTKAITVTEQF